MSSYQLRPWAQVVHLHPDVEAGNLTEAAFAIDLGAVGTGHVGAPINNGPGEPYGATGGGSPGSTVTPVSPTKGPAASLTKEVGLRITGSRDQLFKAWPAIANLADKAGEVSMQITAKNEEGFDPSWLRNAVQEPLEEAEVLESDHE